jgi:hypothetical protein
MTFQAASPAPDGREIELQDDIAQYAYRLQEGDTVILTEMGSYGSITFIEGACDPVSG